MLPKFQHTSRKISKLLIRTVERKINLKYSSGKTTQQITSYINFCAGNEGHQLSLNHIKNFFLQNFRLLLEGKLSYPVLHSTKTYFIWFYIFSSYLEGMQIETNPATPRYMNCIHTFLCCVSECGWSRAKLIRSLISGNSALSFKVRMLGSLAFRKREIDWGMLRRHPPGVAVVGGMEKMLRQEEKHLCRSWSRNSPPWPKIGNCLIYRRIASSR